MEMQKENDLLMASASLYMQILKKVSNIVGEEMTVEIIQMTM
jgi:hypothetical protein